MMVAVADIGRLAIELVWQSLWCFVLLGEYLYLQGLASNLVL